jgi:hypothetical protein
MAERGRGVRTNYPTREIGRPMDTERIKADAFKEQGVVVAKIDDPSPRHVREAVPAQHRREAVRAKEKGLMASQDLIAAVARLVRNMPRNPDVIAVDEALKAELANAANRPVANAANKPRRDRNKYQRDLMRKRRAAVKDRAASAKEATA